VHADPVRLAQVFGNLLNNATRYGCPGGHIGVDVRREGEEAVVRVEDDGTGIAPEVLPHVFELFVQGSRDSDSVQQGLGIGLALVQRLVELHGGSASACSDGPGRGACFTVRLPLAPPASAAAAPIAGTGQLQGLRVLIVDDNVDAALSLAMVLDTLGIERAVTHDGPSSLAMLDAFRPHAALLDIGMRGMDGYELARRIRQLPQHADILLIAVSGWAHSPDLQRSREAGIDHHLAKPVDLAQLTALLSQRAQLTSAQGALG
jgi:CheY-like chemotaxis protein